MSYLYRLVGFLAVTMSVTVHADIITDWERLYHIGSNSEAFVDTAIDGAGNVYAIGSRFNGTNNDAIVVKYGAGGGLHWAIAFTGAGDQVGRCIEATADGQNLFIAFDSNPFVTKLISLNPANGAQLWTRILTVSAPNEVKSNAILLEYSTVPRVHWNRTYRNGNVQAVLTNWTMNFTGLTIAESSHTMPNPNHHYFDSALRSGGGYLCLTGVPNAADPLSSLLGFSVNGSLGQSGFSGTGTALASTAASGGFLYAVGRSGSDRIAIQKLNQATLTVMTTFTDIFTGLTDIRILSAICGPTGQLVVGGKESVPGSGTEWILAAYNTSGARQWRTVRPATVSNEEFRKVVADPFGSYAVLGVRPGATDQLFTQVYDGNTGTKMGQSQRNAPSGSNSVLGLSVNDAGILATGGTVVDGGGNKGLLWKTSQNGIKRLTSTQGSYKGGTVAVLSVAMYAATGSSRTIAMTSNSAFAPVPATVTVLANTLSRGFNSATLATAVPRTITITGTWQGATRTLTFYLTP